MFGLFVCLCAFCCDVFYCENTSEISVLPRAAYEFPNGYNTDFGEERFRIAESLFNPAILNKTNATNNNLLDVVHLITNSINMCDAELRSVRDMLRFSLLFCLFICVQGVTPFFLILI